MSKEIHDLSAALEGVVADLAPSLVSVMSHRSRSSGFVWRAGLIVTSDERLADEGEIHLALPGGHIIPAQLVGRDPSQQAPDHGKADSLNDRLARDRVRIAIEVAEPALAARIASALAEVEELELVGRADEADVLIVAAPGAVADIALTAMELEVLALLAEGASN